MQMKDKILARLAEVSDQMGLPSRSDLVIVDIEPIDNLKCNVLVAYSRSIHDDNPTLSQVEEFVTKTFHNKVTAQLDTARIHEDNSAISMCLTMNCPTRSIVELGSLARVAGNGYMDPNTKHIWRVVNTASGSHLVRDTDENIAEIVQARLDRSSRKHARFAQIRQAAPLLSVGDTVRFYDGTSPLVGKITSISGSDVAISASGKSFKVSKDAVWNVVERAEKAVSEDRNNLEDYWARAVGNADFARQLTKDMSRDNDSMGRDTGFSGTTGDRSSKSKK